MWGRPSETLLGQTDTEKGVRVTGRLLTAYLKPVQVLLYISASRLHHIYIFSQNCRRVMLYFDGVLLKLMVVFWLELHDTNPKSELC